MASLNRSWQRTERQGQFALVFGRRRVGKTYLLRRFVSAPRDDAAIPHVYYLAEQSTAARQRYDLAALALEALPDVGSATVEEIAVTWGALFRYITSKCIGGRRFCLIIDEFPYLVDQSPELPSVLQSWWDREAIHSGLFTVLCGSQLSAMQQLGASNAPLFGRFNAGILRIGPMRYDDVAQFYSASRRYSKRDALVMYGALGGTPRYHALADTSLKRDSALIELLFQPFGPLENEIRFLLSSDRIRDPSPYNAVLTAIASGDTKFSEIQQQTGQEKGTVSWVLRELQDLEWIRRELPFGETSDRRAIYVPSDPFVSFWYRFVFRLSSEIQFGDPERIYRDRVLPNLPNYMGARVFEGVCAQWLARYANSRLGLTIRRMGRYWSRDGKTEIDLVAELEDGSHLFGECKWTESGRVGLDTLVRLRAKVESLPDPQLTQAPRYAIFSTGPFAPDLVAAANTAGSNVSLIGIDDLLPDPR